ncbi:glycosyltransferase family 2 protein [Paenibacillus macerans]|uniref:glycosyltransferase family 2 protein n=2 Tax=Paenibacillus macerans TaxID=44252 RepID=UPI003D2C75B6
MALGRNRKPGKRQGLSGPDVNRKEDSRRAYEHGYAAGYAHGIVEGKRSFGAGFEGTSIIIPTYNRKDLLAECLDRIEAHTAPPYEVIVVDNGSDDGTVDEVRRRRNRVRLAVHPQNLGFARAVNTGLMMAKGQTIVLLNNDVLVTERWLDQLLGCLKLTGAAAVGPVTNYIGGDQQIDVPYEDVAEMPAFAAAYNAPDPRKWREVSRLVGFCLLFPRSTLEQAGYFDEGYIIGNYEDDDWVARLLLQGKRMVMAGDTFVHHYGSSTMKALGAQGFEQVNARNHDYFAEKWGDLHGFLLRKPESRTGQGQRAVDFYPTHTYVKGWSDTVYWLEHGVRHPVSAALPGVTGGGPAPVRLSVVDLLQIPVGAPQTPAEPRAEETAGLPEGAVARSTDGRLYQIDRGQRREIMSEYACRVWNLRVFPEMVPSHILQQYPAGLPITPPPRIISEDL